MFTLYENNICSLNRLTQLKQYVDEKLENLKLCMLQQLEMIKTLTRD